MQINIGAYQESLYMHYQITTDNYEQNESPMTPENLIKLVLYYSCIFVFESNS